MAITIPCPDPYNIINTGTGTGTGPQVICSGYIGQLDSHTVPMRGSFRGSTIIWGVLVPLQTWAWSRIPVLSHQLDRHVELDPCALLGAMWCISFDLTYLLSHVLLTYRD
ncbi:hypothetical protein M9H77_09083 [Catharanthus roseus]|uniref:Uncharacterized protein n=1 Tax=Catharanthus roseus TaxID=4058 RepID=A0ACC0C017_CATRO|nr:hypothetical protein M9H77_09083 [Catharanthus roseus]